MLTGLLITLVALLARFNSIFLSRKPKIVLGIIGYCYCSGSCYYCYSIDLGYSVLVLLLLLLIVMVLFLTEGLLTGKDLSLSGVNWKLSSSSVEQRELYSPFLAFFNSY